MKARKFVLCIDNTDYPASLEKGKVYECLPDREAETLGQWRVIDESGEDYLFSASRFVPVKLSDVAKIALFTVTEPA